MSTQTTEIDQISWRSVAGLLVRAFLCSIVTMLSLFTGIWAMLFSHSSMIFSGDPFLALLLAALTVFLFGVSLSQFKIHPEKKQRHLRAVILGAVIMLCAYIYGTLTLMNLDTSYWGGIFGVIGIWVALIAYLLSSKQITAWQDWVGFLMALLVGIGLNITGFYRVVDWPPVFFIPPVWLSMAFFPELLRFHAGWKGAMVGFMLWVVLGLLSYWIIGMLPRIFFG